MTAPLDLGLERLNNRDGGRFAHLGKVTRIVPLVAEAGSEPVAQTTREALNNAVFTARGVTEWLGGLRRAVAALLRSRDSNPQVPVASDAICVSDADSGAG